MIPKIIHYSWFSGDPYPRSVRLYLETWHKLLPDYEFVLWDAERVKEVDCTFVKEALQERKWAFASDVVRCYAVYTYGGIWLDTDVEVLQSFDPYLKYKLFIGREGLTSYQMDGDGLHVFNLGSHCFGAEMGHPFLARCLDYYKNRHFVLSVDTSFPEKLRYDMRLLPDIQCAIARSEFGYDGTVGQRNKTEDTSGGMHIEPYWVFENPRYEPVKKAVCVHHIFGAWSPQNKGRDYDKDGLFRPKRKDLYYYMFTWMNKMLRHRGYVIQVLSV